MRSWFDVRVLLPLLAALLGSLGWYHLQSSGRDLSLGAPPQSPPQAPEGAAVAVAGLVEAQSENIAIGSALAGLVLEVHVPSSQVGREVRAGEPLFRVDDRHLRAQLKLAEQEREVARARLARLEQQPRAEELPPSRQRVQAAEERVKLARDRAERVRRLFTTRSIAEEDLIEKTQELLIAQRELDRVHAEDALLRAGAWEPDKQVVRFEVRQAQARVDQLTTEIDRATVRAPVAGQILQVNVRPGEFVSGQPGQVLMVLGDLRRLHVRVDIDEQDLPRFRSGARAWATARGDTEQRIGLTFVRVEPYVVPKRSLTGDVQERIDTRVLRVIYALESPHSTLYVGQQLDVYIE